MNNKTQLSQPNKTKIKIKIQLLQLHRLNVRQAGWMSN